MASLSSYHTVVLLDEAQNAEEGQLKMLLTRIGDNSRLIMTGNPSMCDLDPRRGQPYRDLLNIMNCKPYIDGLAIVRLGVEDVVRSSIVQKIVEKIGE
jgi:phosphate starvation-inducible PhoH-like protein